MLKLHLLSLFAFGTIAASISTSDCAKLAEFKNDFDQTCKDSPVSTFSEPDQRSSHHDQRVALHQYMFFVYQQTVNIAAYVHRFSTPENKEVMAEKEAQLRDTVAALRRKIADMDDTEESDLSLTPKESALISKAAHLSCLLEEMQETMEGDMEKKCNERNLVGRQAGLLSNTFGGVLHVVDGSATVVGTVLTLGIPLELLTSRVTDAARVVVNA